MRSVSDRIDPARRPHATMEMQMVFFACSKPGVAAFERLWRDDPAHRLWVNAGVLSDEALAALRSMGMLVTDFTGHVRAADAREMAQAVDAMREHHPAEPIWIEAS
ncbi:hypothetical protein [Burkholderia metallica]|uniref:hypothetical protein n=1 Tax=Burkholderia metallica TaxID=488729 RepID=UPI00158288FD|nr:hypothetical protein [Burkholderia metallica]